jgi:hypothetical protein
MVIHDLDDFGVRHFRKPTTGILNRENDDSTYGFGFFPLKLELDGMVKWVCLGEVPNSNG